MKDTKKIEDLILNNLNNENDIIALMIRIRKDLETLSQSTRNKYLNLLLYCNWIAHTKITGSNTGLRILARINDTLVRNKAQKNHQQLLDNFTESVGFQFFRKELKDYLDQKKIPHPFNEGDQWQVFLKAVIDCVNRSPISFPPPAKLSDSQRRIYEGIISNPIKPGAGVIEMKLIRQDPNDRLPVYPNNDYLLVIRSEDTTSIILPLQL